MQTKKGFILIYTILVGIVCLIIMMYVFDIQVTEVKYSSSSKRNILKEDNYQKQKEYLLTLFSTYIDANKVEIKEKGINNFFVPGSSTSGLVNYEEAKVICSNINEFIFITPYELRKNRNDYFKLKVIGESYQIIFIKTVYADK